MTPVPLCLGPVVNEVDIVFGTQPTPPEPWWSWERSPSKQKFQGAKECRGSSMGVIGSEPSRTSNRDRSQILLPDSLTVKTGRPGYDVHGRDRGVGTSRTRSTSGHRSTSGRYSHDDRRGRPLTRASAVSRPGHVSPRVLRVTRSRTGWVSLYTFTSLSPTRHLQSTLDPSSWVSK